MKTTIKVAALIINKKDEVLLIKEKYKPEDKPKWNLVKGTFDNDKETLDDCIIREIKEEVGVKAKDPVLKNIFHYGDRDNSRILFVFVVNKFLGTIFLDSEDNQSSRSENILDFKWFSQKEIKKLSKKDFMAPYVFLSLKDYKNNKQVGIKRI